MTANTRSRRVFSKLNLVIFSVIFAVIGGYVILNSFAATPASSSVDHVVPYDIASPWNQPIPANVQVDSNSTNNIQFLSSLNKGLTSDVTTCTVPVYIFDSTTPRADVTIYGNYREYLTSDSSESANTKPARNVAIPAVAAAEQGCDGQIEFWNPTTGEQFGFWLFGGNASTGYHAENGYHYFTKAGFYGRFAGGHAGRGAGTPYLAGLVRPWELYQGRIDHAIAFAYEYPCCGTQSSAATPKTFVYPAAKSDGASSNLNSAPEGARFQLNPNLTDAQIQNSPTHATTPGLGCTGPCFTIAKALQKYGMYSIDNSGSSKIYLEDNNSANWDLTALGVSSASAIRNIPSKLTPNNDWSNFRVVAPPCNPVTTTCSTTPTPKPGDTNGDNLVNIIDLSTLLSHWNAIFTAADFNSDGTVNIVDLSILLSNYGK